MCGLIYITFLPKAKVYHYDFSMSIFENQKGIFFLFISIMCQLVHKYSEYIFEIKAGIQKLGKHMNETLNQNGLGAWAIWSVCLSQSLYTLFFCLSVQLLSIFLSI